MNPEMIAKFSELFPGVDTTTPEGMTKFNQWATSQQNLGTSLVGFNDLTTGDPISDAANTALHVGATTAAEGGNTRQVQGGQQSGGYLTGGQQSTIGSSNQTTQQGTKGTSSQTDTQNVTGTQNTANTGTTTDVSNQVGSTVQSGTNVQNTSGQQQSATQQQGSENSLQNTQNVQTGQSQQATKNQGVSTTNVVDQYGLGNFLQSTMGDAKAADASRNQFLTQSMQQGNPYLQQQTTTAVNRALSGPGMQGVGNSAMGRAAGYAASDVAQNSFNGQLQAASLLGQGGQSQAILSSASPFMGSTTSSDSSTLGQTLSNLAESGSTSSSTQSLLNSLNNTLSNQNSSGSSTANTATNQANTNTQNTNSNQAVTNNQSTSGTQNLATTQDVTGKQSTQTGQTESGLQSGTATGSNYGIAVGEQPTQQTSGSGCFVCTALVERKRLSSFLVKKAVESKVKRLKIYKLPLLGYMAYGPWLARATLAHSLLAAALEPICRAILYRELACSRPLPFKPFASFWHLAFTLLSVPFAVFGIKYVKDAKVVSLLNKHGLNFKHVW